MICQTTVEAIFDFYENMVHDLSLCNLKPSITKSVVYSSALISLHHRGRNNRIILSIKLLSFYAFISSNSFSHFAVYNFLTRNNLLIRTKNKQLPAAFFLKYKDKTMPSQFQRRKLQKKKTQNESIMRNSEIAQALILFRHYILKLSVRKSFQSLLSENKISLT